MKKLILLLLLIVPVCLFSENVKKETILKVAEKVYRKDFPASQNVTFEDVIVVKNETDTVYYIVSYPKGGFVIVSGDSSAPPVLGKCKKGVYDPKIMPPGLLVLLERYKFTIAEMKAKKIKQSDEIKKQWDEYTDENYLTLKSYSIGSYMVKTTWGQENGYNRFCPTGCPAGCSAVAMAQVLWYWKCRIKSDWGSYNWNSMGLGYANNDNALLIYHCGLACDTNYDTDGSTSTPNKIKNGLDDHMGCKSDVNVIWQNSHLTNWRDWLEDEIDAERPIIYNAGNLTFAGHSWVIDGYDSFGKFHCNWGWNGDYNDYYSLGDFSTPNGSFNTFDSAVIKIIPEQDNGVGTPQLQAHVFTNSPNGYRITIPEVYGATSYQWTTSHGTITGTGTAAVLKSDCSANVQVRAYNSRCNIYSPYSSNLITINYGTIAGPGIVCPSGTTFSVPNKPSGATVTWSATSTQNNLSIDPSTGYAYATNGTIGTGTITAVISTSCVTKTLPPYNVFVADFPTPTVSGAPTAKCGYNYVYHVDQTSQAAGQTFYWESDILEIANPYDKVCNALPVMDGEGTISCTVTACGISKTASKYISAYLCETLLVSPNPSTNETIISIESNSEDSFDTSALWDLEVYDQTQQLKVKKSSLKEKNIKLQTSDWNNGVYIIKAKIEGRILSGKLIVKH